MLRGKWSDCGRRECVDSDLLVEEEQQLKAEIIEDDGFERDSMQLWDEGGQRMFQWAKMIGMAHRYQ